MKINLLKILKPVLSCVLGILILNDSNAQSPGGVNKRLKLWLKADTATGTAVNNASISTWRDVSGRGFQATQSTSGSQPKFKTNSKDNINFNPVVFFDGNDGLNVPYDTAWNSSITGFSIHALNKSTSTVSRHLMGVPGYWSFYNAPNGNIRGLILGIDTINNAGCIIDQSELLSYSFKKGTGLTTNINSNGAGSTVWGSGAYSYSNSNTTNSLNIGYTGVRYWLGPIGEQIIYDTTLSVIDRQKIHSYLAIKYGQTLISQNYLATDGSTVWNLNFNQKFKNSVAGIGRDDAEGLNQKQSMSSLQNFQVIIGNGGIANTNKLNSNNFSVDKSYLIWGDNNGSISFSKGINNNVPTGINQASRMIRVWKVQETGTVGIVTIAIPDSLFNSATYLVCSSDSSFSSSCTWSAMSTATINGKLYRTATFDFSTGQFFTFASQIVSPGGLPSVAFWIKADDQFNTSLNDGALMSKWANLGSVGKQLLSTNTNISPQYKINNTALYNYNPYVNFTGVSGFHIGNDSSWNKDVTIFSVNLVKNTANHKTIISSMSSNSGWWTYCLSTTAWSPYSRALITKTGVGTNTNSMVSATETMSPGEVELTGFDLKLGKPGKMNVYANGRTIQTSSLNYARNTSGKLTVGSYSEWVGWYMDGSIAEQIIFPGILSVKQRQMVNTYLGVKYGISLTHHYISSDSNTIVWNRNLNAKYNFNISGIGRDDNSGLNQKQSKSSNPGYQVEMALNQFEANNLKNTNQFTSDKVFLIWGDNGLASGFSISMTSNKPVGLGKMARMSRVWKVQQSGAIDSVTLMIEKKVFNGTSKYLLLSNDSTFTNSVTWLSLSDVSFNGKNYLKKRVLPSNLKYFTFASDAIFPGGIEGAAVWLKANDIASVQLSDNSNFTFWANNGSKGGDVTGDITKSPTYRRINTENINFNPVVSFDGADNYLKIDNGIFGTSNYTATSMFAVSVSKVVKNCNLAYEVLSSGNFSMQSTTGSSSALWAAPSNAQLTMPWGGQINMPYLWTGFNNNAKSPKNEFYRNGTLLGSNNTTTSFKGANSPMYIGSNSNSNNYFNGNIGEIIIYQNALTIAQKQKIETYLAIKYGTTISQTIATDYLSTNGTKIWNANLNKAYGNNITGIGRDDDEALNQRQSINTQAGMNVLIGLNYIKSDNLSNTNSFTNDNTYLIWGNSSARTAYTEVITNNLPIGISSVQRMARVWKVQSTGSVGTVQLAISASYISGKDKYLVISNDSSFKTGNTWYKLDSIMISGVNYNSTRLILNNGVFFSFVGSYVNPGGVSKASVWLKANDQDNSTLANNTSLTNWINQSATYSASQITASKKPTYRNNTNDNINFNAIINFDGTDDAMTVPYSIRNNRSTTVFTVYKQSSTQSNRTLISSNSGFSGWHLTLQTNTRQVNIGNGTSWTQLTSNNYSSTIPEVLSFRLDSGAKKNAAVYLNHQLMSSSSSSTYFGNTSGVLNIGALGSSNYFNGAIAEQIVFDTTISTTERQMVGSYLAIKYGISLDQTLATNYLATNANTIIWNANKNRSFRYNIAGIGRDDKEGLNQKQSNSINNGRQVAIGIGSIAADNQSNTNSINNDLSYLVWGDNNLSMNFSEPITNNLPGGVSNVGRMKRVWKLEKTGNLNTFQVGIPGTYRANDIKYLVVSNDSSFKSGCTWYTLSASTVNAKQYWTANLNLSNGQFITFVGREFGPGGVKGASLWLKSNDQLYASTHSFAQTNNNIVMPYWTNYGSGPDAYQTVVSSQPKFSYDSTVLLNLNPNVTFGSPYTFKVDSDLGITGQQATVFSVNRNLGGNGFMLQPNTALSNGMTLSSSPQGNSTFGLLGSTTATGTNSNSGSVYITSGKRYNSNLTASVNGKDLSTVSGSSNFAAANGYLLNSNAGGTYLGTNNRSAEVVVFPYNLTEKQSRQVNSYLAVKYGITLDQSVVGQNYLSSDSNQIIWNSGKNSKYNKNIAGIGRDDQSNLDQRISLSQNAGSQVLIGNGGAYAGTNLLHNVAFTSNKQYFIWGDNGSSTTIDVKLVSGNRMSKVWKVQNTGSVSQVRAGLPASVFSNNVSNKYLIVSTDSTFKGAFKRYLLGSSNINGVAYYNASAQINDGEFFTFANLDCNYPELAAPAVRTLANAGYCNVNGWLYYKDPSNASQALVAIHPNGNTWNPDSVILDVSNPLPHSQTDGTHITALSPRMLTIIAPGTFTVNGGVKIRFFYDESEFSSIPSTTRNWFKHKGRKIDVLKNLHPNVLDSIVILYPDSVGTEGYLDFVEFHRITSFSTFGYGGTTRLTALPLKLIGFNARANGKTSQLNWKVYLDHSENVKFELERSADGVQWSLFNTIEGTYSTNLFELNSSDPSPYKPVTFYRIKITNQAGNSFYSNMIKVDFGEDSRQTVVYPNPSTGILNVNLSGELSSGTAQILDLDGRVLYSKTYFEEEELVLDLKAFHQGLYIVRLFNEFDQFTEKIMIQTE